MDPYDQLDAQEKLYQRIGSKSGNADRRQEKKLARAFAKMQKADEKAQARLHSSNEKAAAERAKKTNTRSSTGSKPLLLTPQQRVPKATLLKLENATKNVGGASKGFMVAINKWKDLFF